MIASSYRERVVAGLVAGLVACSSTAGMSDDEVARCLDASSGRVSPQHLLPDEAIASAGSSAEEYETTFDRVFHETYGIHVDDFLDMRDVAEEEITLRLGEPPAAGELVSDEWFLERDHRVLDLWNDRHPESARTYCELLEG